MHIASSSVGAAATGPDAKSCEVWEGRASSYDPRARRPASVWSLLPGPGDGQGTVSFRLSDERAVEAASVRVAVALWRPAADVRRPSLAARLHPNVA